MRADLEQQAAIIHPSSMLALGKKAVDSKQKASTPPSQVRVESHSHSLSSLSLSYAGLCLLRGYTKYGGQRKISSAKDRWIAASGRHDARFSWITALRCAQVTKDKKRVGSTHFITVKSADDFPQIYL